MTLINIGLVVLIAHLIPKSNDQTQSQASEGGAINQASASMLELPSESSAIVPVSNSKKEKTKKNIVIRKAVDPAVQEFLAEISEARIMDREEGKLAAQRGTTRSIKEYGRLMVADQTQMLKELNAIAKERDADIASELGRRKAMGLSDLQALHGKNFDSKFIRMMIVDHRRDVRKLQKATRSDDADIQVFATKYLPIVQDHLEQIERIKKEMKK